MMEKIRKLAEARVKFLVSVGNSWYKWSSSYLERLRKEVEETKEQYKDNNSVYLEDELGDIFWDFFCLSYSLQNEWKITSIEKVLERCYKKFSGRTWNDWNTIWDWEIIKAKQKEELKKEHEERYKKD
jgi:NTP pyrophosphatase (non-canonical NTP hydrolase)